MVIFHSYVNFYQRVLTIECYLLYHHRPGHRAGEPRLLSEDGAVGGGGGAITGALCDLEQGTHGTHGNHGKGRSAWMIWMPKMEMI